MLEINLIKKRKAISSKVLGLDPSKFNLKMLLIAAIVYYGPVEGVKHYYDGMIKAEQLKISKLQSEKKKIEKEVRDNEALKHELEAYNNKIRELKEKEKQVEKIVKQKTNPKNLLERLARTMPEDI